MAGCSSAVLSSPIFLFIYRPTGDHFHPTYGEGVKIPHTSQHKNNRLIVLQKRLADGYHALKAKHVFCFSTIKLFQKCCSPQKQGQLVRLNDWTETRPSENLKLYFSRLLIIHPGKSRSLEANYKAVRGCLKCLHVIV